MQGKVFSSIRQILSSLAPATALAVVWGLTSTAPSRADVLLLAAGGGGGAGDQGSNGGDGLTTGNGGDGSGTGGLGGQGGQGGLGGGAGGINYAGAGGGGAGWSGNGADGSHSTFWGQGGLSAPSFAGGKAHFSPANGGFGGGGGAGWQAGGGGGGGSGGGGGGYSGGGGGGGLATVGSGGGGGGSYIAAGFSSLVTIPGANGISHTTAAGQDGYVSIDGALLPDTGTVQIYTVATSGIYKILAAGAQGGSAGPGSTTIGGYGALVGGDIFLTAGTVLDIVVGQGGRFALGADVGGGGGGGSFVWETYAAPAPGPVPGAGLAGFAFLVAAGGLVKARGLRSS
jgi:hypothetical protein